jgi:hypothetical protein
MRSAVWPTVKWSRTRPSLVDDADGVLTGSPFETYEEPHGRTSWICSERKPADVIPVGVTEQQGGAAHLLSIEPRAERSEPTSGVEDEVVVASLHLDAAGVAAVGGVLGTGAGNTAPRACDDPASVADKVSKGRVEAAGWSQAPRRRRVSARHGSWQPRTMARK